MKKKQLIIQSILTILISGALTLAAFILVWSMGQKIPTKTVVVRSIGQAIIAQGKVHSLYETTLHFQTGGKLVYLPFKEGDQVFAGQTIAQLDTYPLQRQLQQALNNYRLTRNIFDQTQANAQNNILQGQQRFLLETQTKSAITTGDSENIIINDIIKRIIDENQANLDNSVINVELSNYALQLASLQAPFNGIITHEDVNVVNQNITPLTSFSIADPTHLVFRADVSGNDISFVRVGSPATIILTGQQKKITGVVTKIYPTRTTTLTGEDVYKVDITADGLTGAPFGQTGVISIIGSNQNPTVVVPTWTILGHTFIWILKNNNTPVLQKITVGASHNETTEVYKGLKNGDKIIINPESVARRDYIAL